MQRFAGTKVTLIILAVATNLSFTHSSDGGQENVSQRLSRSTPPKRNVADPSQKALYCVGYAHLDTQWRWDFVTTIDKYLKSTLDDNFAMFEAYPEFVFSFTGSVRYEMMKEYYPRRYERLKRYIAENRWFVSGSSVDEGDVNVPSSESIIRQVLYGNLFFKREFDRQSVDFMLPDCFGFPASMPSLWAHCGLIGFSTQKLTWGSAVGIPFSVGVWEGPDGNGVIAALDPGSYATAIEGRVDQNPDWIKRVNENGELYGLWADYHYYGVGDQGGAPKEKDIRNYIESQRAPDRKIDLVLASSDQLYGDITPELRASLPRFSGDMLLTEHSAGTLTSQSFMKRCNRKAEQLADAAERAATCASWLGLMKYPRSKLERAWVRLLANQMHDILPGTSIPRAYRYSWNDDIVALNQFAHVLTDAVGSVATNMNTMTKGIPLVVFNPVAIDRTDIVQAVVPGNTAAVRVFGPDGKEVPSQIVSRADGKLKLIFPAHVDANGFAVFDVRPAETPFEDGNGPNLDARTKTMENDSYRVTFNAAGDIEQIVDRRNGRNLLARPATLDFTYERPKNWPAWNMDWKDRKNPPIGSVDGIPQWRIVEDGPVRASIAVTREARNSRFTQIVSLARGDAGRVVDIEASIDWQSASCALKASFPLTVAAPEATYNWGMGTISRGNNEPVKYEVPSHEWIDLSQDDANYGVTILEDSRFGSDKPADNEIRLTLLYTPGIRGSYKDQHSQDWGVHEIHYGIYGHEGDFKEAGSEWRGRRLNQPLRAFVVDRHDGPLGRSFSMAKSSSRQVDIRAIKIAEESERIILRVQELWGRNAKIDIAMPSRILHAHEADGQERTLHEIRASNDTLSLEIGPFGIKTIALQLDEPGRNLRKPKPSTTINLPFDVDVASHDTNRADGAMDTSLRSFPGELLPAQLVDNRVTFELGKTTAGEMQAVACRGQTISLTGAEGTEIHIVAAATEDTSAEFYLGKQAHRLNVQSWTGFVGQWYDRVWDTQFNDVDYKCDGKVVSVLPAFVKRAPIAWFATHRHHPELGNEAYRFSYLYHYVIPRHDGRANTITLPYDERIRIFAISVADAAPATPTALLYDDFPGARPIDIRHVYPDEAEKVFEGREAIAQVQAYRAPKFEQLGIGPPRNDDDIDTSRKSNLFFMTFEPNEELVVHQGAGAVDGKLVRLNDGLVAENDDDTNSCVWYDNEGRFSIDLEKPQVLKQIDTYSWHQSNRAPQYFSIWGSNNTAMPPADFNAHNSDQWELIAVVDTRVAGEGQIHATRVQKPDGQLGPFRHLLWISEDVGEGTFFTEIDIEFTENTP